MPVFSLPLKKREQSIGVRVTEIKSETRIPTVTTTAKAVKKRPIMPPIKMTGAKIQAREKVAASTAKNTWLVPSRAACRGSMSGYFSRKRKMFSRTTMASSTTTPMSKSKANKVILLKVKPLKYMTMIAPSREIGIAVEIIRVERNDLRKRKTTRAANRVPIVM